ncbi:MAG: hypothetical protein R2851_12560 [Caldilineaceae bacterium]
MAGFVLSLVIAFFFILLQIRRTARWPNMTTMDAGAARLESHRAPRKAQRTAGRVALYVAVIAVAVVTFFPIYWMLVSTF